MSTTEYKLFSRHCRQRGWGGVGGGWWGWGWGWGWGWDGVVGRWGGVSILKCRLTSIRILMLKIRRSRDRLIFNMESPIPGKDGLYIETGPWFRNGTE